MNSDNSAEKREFLRIDHESDLQFKILCADKLSAKREVMSRNLSASGLLFRTDSESAVPAISGIVWIKLDDKMMNICNEIEEDLIIFDDGLFGRIVRISEGEPGVSYDVGVSFLRKKNMSEEDISALIDGVGK